MMYVINFVVRDKLFAQETTLHANRLKSITIILGRDIWKSDLSKKSYFNSDISSMDNPARGVRLEL